MIRTGALLREADPADRFDLPDVDRRAERELAALLGREPSTSPRERTATARRSTRRVAVRRLAITGTMLILVATATAITLSVVHPSAPAADGVATAQPVVFDTDPTAAATDEQDLLEVVTRERPSDSALMSLQASLPTSAQLRLEATYSQYGRQGRYTATGSHTFTRDVDDDRDDAGRLVGGWQSGADAVSIIVMRCPGSGGYSWTVRGRTVDVPSERTIAHAEGRCGPGMTAARFILGGKQLITSIEVTAPAGRTYSLGQFTFSHFASPELDTPFPTDD